MFVNNRLKEIDSMLNQIRSKFVKVNFAYVPSVYNLADLVTNSVLSVSDPEPILDIRKFSSFTFLLGVMVKVFKFIVLFKKVNRGPVETTTRYLFKLMQSEEFAREIAYLESPSSFNESPKLVSKLNLFLDQKDLIRFKGRIEKNVDLKYDVVNPLVMAKNHHLTKLLIYYAHCQSMHMGL